MADAVNAAPPGPPFGIAGPVVVHDLLARADHPATDWEPLRPGVWAHWLYRWESGPSAALLRYEPGALMPRHRHAGTEQILVLRGSQADEAGHYPAGSMAVHAAGSSHAVHSEEGCVVLAIWERPVVSA
ncbi:MAG: hypothetical protein JWO31_730 [Phycisphaerales bacterium]|nr:hypothetical protein [Phycisphaerales bacterium]